MALINALRNSDFNQVMEFINRGPEDNIDLDQLIIEVNRVNFTDEQLNAFWAKLEYVYPIVHEFWDFFDKSFNGFPFIFPSMTNNQVQAMYLGAIYYRQKDVQDYIEDNFQIEITPMFEKWLAQCQYQASCPN